MSAAKQMNLFEKQIDPWVLDELMALEQKQDNLRRGVFQRYSALLKFAQSLQDEIIELRQMIRKD